MPVPQPIALIVEDDIPTAEMFSEMLRISGYVVEHAADGNQALDLLTNRAPDVILLDLMMPGTSGLDFLTAMHALPRGGQPPVIVVSSRGTPLDARELEDVGAQAYLAKPVSFQELQWAVSKALQDRTG